MKVTSEQELAEAIRGANGPLRVQGGGTRDVGRPVAGEVLEVAISGVVLYEPGALTLVVGAGTPLAEIEALLATEGQRLAFEPLDFRAVLGTSGVPTIGGAVAANASGPRRIQAGAVRDHALGMRFVDGAGRVIRNGGRVMKNVTGYDLVKLMAGSWGTLGVISEVSLKVQPAPEAVITLSGRAGDAAQAVALMSAALGSPFDVTGAAARKDGAVRIRLEGHEASVRYRAQALIDGPLAGFEAVLSNPGAPDAWAGIAALAPFAATRGDLWRISLRPGDAPGLLAGIGALGSDWVLDWGGGLIWLATAEGVDTGEAARAIRAALAPLGGHATLIRAGARARAQVEVFQPQPAPLAAISRGLKQKFDPRGILNPGLMGF
ncbi:MAG: glycolate oxidase subunit GlcE [Paracoccaceae bacterium]